MFYVLQTRACCEKKRICFGKRFVGGRPTRWRLCYETPAVSNRFHQVRWPPWIANKITPEVNPTLEKVSTSVRNWNFNKHAPSNAQIGRGGDHNGTKSLLRLFYYLYLFFFFFTETAQWSDNSITFYKRLSKIVWISRIDVLYTDRDLWFVKCLKRKCFV